MNTDFWAHPSALVDSNFVGRGTRVWAFSHIMQNVEIGEDCNIGEHVFIEDGVRLGNRVTVKNLVQIWEGVMVEDDVFIGPGAVFTNDRFPRSPRSEAAGDRYKSKQWLLRTKILKGASIGAHATLMCGLQIGSYAVVGAGAVVTKSVAPFALVVGIPAVQIAQVCCCGQPLKNKRGNPHCSACGRRYLKSGDGLVEKKGLKDLKGLKD